MELSPLNDLAVAVGPLNAVDASGVKAAITSGAVTGFLATTDAPDATSYDANWQQSLTYVGGANGYDVGWWLYRLDGSYLTKALCDTAFGTTQAVYLHVLRTSDVRTVIRLDYVASRRAVPTQ